MNDSTISVIRAVLKIGGGYFIAKGYADDSKMEVIISGILAALGVLWGILHRSKAPVATQGQLFKLLILGGLVSALVSCSVGCATRQPAPSAIEQKLFTIQTNYVPVVLIQTNIVMATNFATGEVSGIPEVMAVTNQKSQYNFTPNATAAGISAAAGGVGAIWGVGGITGTVVGALFSLWAWFRNRQASAAAANLAQVIETGREVLLSLPDGEKYDAAWKAWMMEHQTDAGVVQTVAQIVGGVVNNDAAKGAAKSIVELIQGAKDEAAKP